MMNNKYHTSEIYLAKIQELEWGWRYEWLYEFPVGHSGKSARYRGKGVRRIDALHPGKLIAIEFKNNYEECLKEGVHQLQGYMKDLFANRPAAGIWTAIVTDGKEGLWSACHPKLPDIHWAYGDYETLTELIFPQQPVYRWDWMAKSINFDCDDHGGLVIRCSRCEKRMPRTEFYHTPARTTGYHNECKRCHYISRSKSQKG